MSLAEQKEELFKFLRNADEATTAKVVDFVKKMRNGEQEFAEEELAEFRHRSAEHQKNPESALPWDDALARIRTKLSS